jgi:Tat protein translocase TatB subunit
VFNVGTPELLVILLVALIVLGPQRLPDAARQVGKAMAELRRLSAGFQAEMRDAMDTVRADPPLDEPVIKAPDGDEPT